MFYSQLVCDLCMLNCFEFLNKYNICDMHPTILAIAGYTLLLSSLVILLIVMRQGVKCRMMNQFYILSISDVLNSALTAVIILGNHIKMISNNHYIENDTSHEIGNNTDIKKTGLYHWNKIFHSSLGINNKSLEEESVTEIHCNMTGILAHYAMMFLPMTNAFISLLIYALVCNSNTKDINKKCNELLKMRTNYTKTKDKQCPEINNMEAEVDFRETKGNTEDSKTANKSTFILESVKNTSLKLDKLKNTNKQTAIIYVLSQWLIPIMVTCMFSFTEHYSKWTTHDNKIDCTYLSNYPFDNCYIFIDPSEFSGMFNTIESVDTEYNYIVSEFPNKIGNTSAVEINNIVSNIYTIVQSVLNSTHDSPKMPTTTTDYNTYESLSEMKDINVQNITATMSNNIDFNETDMSLIEQTLSHETESIFEPWIENVQNASHYLSTQISVLNGVPMDSQYLDSSLQDDTDTKEFSSNSEATIMPPADTQHSLLNSNNTTKVPNDNYGSTTKNALMSKEEIYADILKRIQGLGKTSTTKKKYPHFSAKKPKQNNINDQESKTSYKRKSLTEITNNNVQYALIKLCQSGKCFMPTNYLKLLSLMLAVLNFLIPPIYSSILQERGKMLCQSISERIKAAMVLIFIDKQSLEHNEARELNSNITNLKEQCKDEILFQQKNYISNKKSDDPAIKMAGTSSNICESSSQSKQPSNEWMYSNILQETDNIERIIQTVRVSMILGILLWTPMLLETVSRIYLCIDIPTWIINASFLVAMFFVIIRNIINLNIINIQDSNQVASKKRNSIAPNS